MNNRNISKGIDDIKVVLVSHTPDPINAMYTFIKSTWGDLITNYDKIEVPEMLETVMHALTGKSFAGQTMELVQYTFAISNVSRACTHQLVRTRVGAGYGQQGGRDNNWGDFDFRMPDTVHRNEKLRMHWETVVDAINEAYKAAVEAGVPFQDARFIAPIGIQTNIVETINLRALSALCAARTVNVMQWEINTVTRMMRDEVQKVHPYFAPVLRAMCEKVGRCLSKPTLFPPCGKFPRPEGWDKKEYEHAHEDNGNVILNRVEQDQKRLGIESSKV